ncbi:MAG: glycosyltransferase [Chlamydiae bacterium]|nr:glycosyltransferase [Chlamydiota bacterium]
MLVFHVATELSPLAKAGGLGDVVYGLSKELVRLRCKLHIVLPKYSLLPLNELSRLHLLGKKRFSLNGDTLYLDVAFWEASYEDLSLILIDPEPPLAVFKRKSIYGEEDDPRRFLLFCLAATAYLEKMSPSLVHLHDWPTAPLAFLLRNSRHRTLLTLHNLLHQGRCSPSTWTSLGLPLLSEMQDPCEASLINLLQLGILHAHQLTTVSPTYAKEIQTPAQGYYLNPLLHKLNFKLHGILNGIDLNYWNPYKDSALPFPYPQNSLPLIQDAKAKNKAALYKRLGMPLSERPLFGYITRLDEQKGPHLITHGVKAILELGGYCIILGKVVSPSLDELFSSLKATYAKHPHFHFQDGFDERLAKLLYAAADFIVIPSLFEPCGLTQMIAMRYFTIPIVRATGGLADTVYDFEDPLAEETKKVGLRFYSMDPQEQEQTLKRAFLLYQQRASKESLFKTLALQDFSWKHSAQEYLKLYSQKTSLSI